MMQPAAAVSWWPSHRWGSGTHGISPADGTQSPVHTHTHIHKMHTYTCIHANSYKSYFARQSTGAKENSIHQLDRAA